MKPPMGFGSVIRLVLLGFVIVAIAVAILSFVLPQFITPAMSNMVNDALSTIGIAPRGGVVLGRAHAGVNPPTLAERLEAASAQHVVTAAQEVVMTGTPSSHGCLGADNEVLLEVENDIGADQLDISYTLEDQTRMIRLASCEKDSLIKQCIPNGYNIQLHADAYYHDNIDGPPVVDANGMLEIPAKRLRQEKRVYPHLLTTEMLHQEAKMHLLASAFAA